MLKITIKKHSEGATVHPRGDQQAVDQILELFHQGDMHDDLMVRVQQIIVFQLCTLSQLT
jgi:hypothetical protein